MENIPSNENIRIEPNQRLIEDLNLRKGENGFYYLIEEIHKGKVIEKIEDAHLIFEDYNLVSPEGIKRGDDSTTLFTTAGVQIIETLTKDGNIPPKQNIICFQPVFRSQFMDKVNEMQSTSFINLSAISIQSSYEDYLRNSQKLIEIVSIFAEDVSKISFSFGTDSVKWGSKRFSNSSITIFYDSTEIGECVFIEDYPIDSDKKMSVVDFGLGLERFDSIMNNSRYMKEYEDVYERYNLTDFEANNVIDPLRSMVLISLAGIVPSNKSHGYRLRQLSKRFVQRNSVFGLNEDDLIDKSFDFWLRYYKNNNLNLEQIKKNIKEENQRNTNALFLKVLASTKGINLDIDINQSHDLFINQIKFSLNQNDINDIIKIIHER